MTMETFEKAKEIIAEIEKEKCDIVRLETLIKCDIGEWEMIVRADSSSFGYPINHLGLLPELLEIIYKKHLETLESLKKELAEL